MGRESGRRWLIKRKAAMGRGARIVLAAIVLGGITIGEHAVVTAGAIVTRSVDPKTIMADNTENAVKTIERPAS